MEVPGKQGDQYSELVCLPCERDDIKEQAYGFCQDCQEHLCETCYKSHRRPKPLQNHVLLDKDSMPKSKIMVHELPDSNEGPWELCKNHKDKPLEFYCNDHKSVACYVCVTLEHKQCKVDYIPDVSGNVSDEMNDMLTRMELLITKCSSNIQNANTAAQNLDQSQERVVKDIHIFRKEMNEYLDRLEANHMTEVETFNREAKCKLKGTETACVEIQNELQSLKSLVNTLSEENKQDKLFIELKKAEKRLSILIEKEKQELKKNETVDSFKFTLNNYLLDKLKSENSFGQLSTYVRPSAERTIAINYTNTINVGTHSDGNITGIDFISISKMIVCDLDSKSVKMIDIEKSSLITEIKLSSPPADVVTLPENKVAVTLPKESYIQIMSYTEEEFSLDRQIAVGEKCNGIAYCQGKIIVSSKKGRKLIIHNLDEDIANVLESPACLAAALRVEVSNDENFLYISSTEKDKVMKIDWKGKTMNTFEEPEYKFPSGLRQLEDDTILVCYRDSDELLRLSDNLKRCKILGLNDLCAPKALHYCIRDKKLYISCSSKTNKRNADIIKVFNVKWII